MNLKSVPGVSLLLEDTELFSLLESCSALPPRIPPDTRGVLFFCLLLAEDALLKCVDGNCLNVSDGSLVLTVKI